MDNIKTYKFKNFARILITFFTLQKTPKLK